VKRGLDQLTQPLLGARSGFSAELGIRVARCAAKPFGPASIILVGGGTGGLVREFRRLAAIALTGNGYRESGGYCAPTSDRAPAAVPKRGQCPSGFMQPGAY
jgi:hypothetical protein